MVGVLRVDVRPELLRWARERSRREDAWIARTFPKLGEWENGTLRPTLKQLEAFARAMYTPIGFFFLQKPPVESLPIPDFRTVGGRMVPRPSPNLLDTIYACEQRQAWYRTFALLNGEGRRTFVGSARVDQSTVEVATRMREETGFDIAQRVEMASWKEALRDLIAKMESVGVLVMCSGIVENNTSRPLDVDEFRGFTLVDDFAPLVFVNSRDSLSAQMFTLAHELAHVWLGESGVSSATPREDAGPAIERWCNAVAAEFLAPLDAIRGQIDSREDIAQAKQRIARAFKVSTLVALRRLHDVGRLNGDQLRSAYDRELGWLARRASEERSKDGGGNFHATQARHVGRRFAIALVADTLEGNTLERDALRLLGIRKPAALQSFATHLGLAS